MLFTSSISPLSFENTAPPQEHKRNLRLLLWRQGRIGLDNPLDALRMTNDPSAHCQVKCAIPQATDRSSEQVRSHFPTNAERRSRKSYPGTTRIVRHSQNPQMRCPSLSHPDPVETTCESNSPSPCPSPLGRLTLYHLASTSVVPPSLLRPSSDPPPNANRRKDGGGTEEQRRSDGGATVVAACHCGNGGYLPRQELLARTNHPGLVLLPPPLRRETRGSSVEQPCGGVRKIPRSLRIRGERVRSSRPPMPPQAALHDEFVPQYGTVAAFETLWNKTTPANSNSFASAWVTPER